MRGEKGICQALQEGRRKLLSGKPADATGDRGFVEG
jgi:hypothetical protein